MAKARRTKKGNVKLTLTTDEANVLLAYLGMTVGDYEAGGIFDAILDTDRDGGEGGDVLDYNLYTVQTTDRPTMFGNDPDANWYDNPILRRKESER